MFYSALENASRSRTCPHTGQAYGKGFVECVTYTHLLLKYFLFWENQMLVKTAKLRHTSLVPIDGFSIDDLAKHGRYR
jgi:hypothetical protein